MSRIVWREMRMRPRGQLLDDLFHDKNGPAIKKQAQFFEQTAKQCQQYAKDLRDLEDDTD